MKTKARTNKLCGAALVSAALLAFSSPLFAAEQPSTEASKPQRAVIHFADLGGIKNWRAIGDDAIEIEGRNDKWFRAEFFSYCDGLRTATNIGFITEPNGDLNTYSSIYVGRGQPCRFKTFELIEAPSTQ